MCRHPNCFRKRGCFLCGMYLCPALRKVRRDTKRSCSLAQFVRLATCRNAVANWTQNCVVLGKTADTHQQKRSITTCSRFHSEQNAKQRKTTKRRFCITSVIVLRAHVNHNILQHAISVTKSIARWRAPQPACSDLRVGNQLTTNDGKSRSRNIHEPQFFFEVKSWRT